MTDDEIAGFVTGILGPYIEARITAGDHPDDARRIAQEQTDGSLSRRPPGARSAGLLGARRRRHHRRFPVDRAP